MLDLCTRDHCTVNMDRIAWVRDQNRIATIESGEHQVRQAFFGADGNDGFRIGIELNVEAALVPIGDGFAQPWNTFGHRVAMGVWPFGGLHKFVDDMLGCGAVRVAHRHIDDVFTTSARGHFQFRRNVEDIRREPLNAREFVVHVGGIDRD